MPELIRQFDNRNQPIIVPKKGILSSTYFNLVRLGCGEEYRIRVEGIETFFAVLAGNVDLQVNGTVFRDVGRRRDIWSGQADSVYVTSGASVRVRANQNGTEIAVAGGVCDRAYAPFRIPPEEVEMVDVGSPETRSHRLDRGYHPTVTSPGHEEYIFTILVGKQKRGLVQHFKEDYQYLMGRIPGIQDMVEKFK